MRPYTQFAALLALSATSVMPAMALTWNDAGTTDNWNTTNGNWNSGSTWTNGGAADFSGIGETVNLAEAGLTAGTLLATGTLAFAAGVHLYLTKTTLDLASTDILSVSAGQSITLSDFAFADIIGWVYANAADGTYTLINGGGAVTFGGLTPTLCNPSDFGNGKLGYFQQGSLRAVIIPEPSIVLLGGIGALGFAMRRRHER